jgi:CMP-N,N'-diacetyllegionaminic acid synthase
MKVIGLIPARGGSKGVPGKNLRLVCGKPLLQYTCEAARAARRLERVIVTTDDRQIAEIAQQCGVEVPFMRPPELAKDDTPMIPVVQHALRWLQERGDVYEAVCLLQPTTPLRRPEDINGAIELLETSGADSVISFVGVGEKHPARMKFVRPDGRVVDPPFAEQFEGQRRQELEPLYLREGSIYLTRTSVILEQNSFQGRDCRAWVVPLERACNIDEPFDLKLAEWLIMSDAAKGAGSDAGRMAAVS